MFGSTRGSAGQVSKALKQEDLRNTHQKKKKKKKKTSGVSIRQEGGRSKSAGWLKGKNKTKTGPIMSRILNILLLLIEMRQLFT